MSGAQKVIIRHENDYYDLTDFVDRHPGGKTAISGLSGKNATLLIENHHRNDPKVWKILKSCKVQHDSVEKIPKLNEKDRSLLELQRKWDQKGRLSTFQAALLLGTPALFWVVGACLFQYRSSNFAVAMLGAALHVQGLVQVLAVMHDLSHFQVFADNDTNRACNRWYGILLLGIDGRTAYYDHPVHHTFTNIARLDTALETGPIVFHPALVPAWAPLRILHERVNRAVLIALLSPIHLVRVYLKQLITNLGFHTLPEHFRGLLGSASQASGLAMFNPAWVSPVVVLRTLALASAVGWAFVVQTLMAASLVGMVLAVWSQHYDQEVYDEGEVGEETSFLEHQCNTTEEFPTSALFSFFFCGNQDQHCKHHLLPNVHRWRFCAMEPELHAILAAHGVRIRQRSWLCMLQESWGFFSGGEMAVSARSMARFAPPPLPLGPSPAA